VVKRTSRVKPEQRRGAADAGKHEEKTKPGLGTRIASRFAPLRLKEGELALLPRQTVRPARLTK
jgi:hypothetical protein